MNTLRELCSPPYTHVDQHGRSVIDTDRVQLAIAREDALIGRLVADLARATGLTEAAIRHRYGLGHPTGPNERHRPVSGRERGL